MIFEYDDNKSAANKVKHGIDFGAARAIWEDACAIETPSAKPLNEDRFLITGMVDNKHWTAIITYRGDATRIISVRRARKHEVNSYESQG